MTRDVILHQKLACPGRAHTADRFTIHPTPEDEKQTAREPIGTSIFNPSGPTIILGWDPTLAEGRDCDEVVGV